MSTTLGLPTPVTFPAFPYDPPYDIQLDLMKHLYIAIEHSKVAIIESPTGTGKTLSLLCASLTWLRDERHRAIKGGEQASSDWVTAQAQDRIRRQLLADEEEYEQKLRKARQREKMSKARVLKRQKHDQGVVPMEQDEDNGDDTAFLPEDEQLDTDDNISPAVRALMAKFQHPQASNADDPTCTKVYYASRTHSQLAQVLPELIKLKLAKSPNSSTPVASQPIPSLKRSFDEEEEEDGLYYTPRFLSLGSRKQLCIHDKLRQSRRDLDEGCRELLEEKGDGRCPYLLPPELMVDFRDQILSSPKDIEDLATAGKEASICPYFGSRRAIPQAELVTLPYNLLLLPSAREALGIDLTGQIVVIDEAHNLPTTLLSLSTANLPLATLETSLAQLDAYVKRFKTRLSAVNMLHLKRLAVVLVGIRGYLSQAKPGTNEVMTVSLFVDKLGTKAGSVNLLEIVAYLKKSKVAQKICHYSDKVDKAQVEKQRDKGKPPPLYAVEGFLLSLTGKNDDGRITLSVSSAGHAEVKYQLLNPAPQFADLVNSARSVILAGGTMSPMSEITSQLFPHLPPERLTTFSCGHIIPSSNLRALVVPKGPKGTELEVTSAKQTNVDLVTELGQILVNFASCVHKGMVVFFPSYRFLNFAKDQWKSGVLDRLASRKKLFFEPETSLEVDRTLQEYAEAMAVGSGQGTKGGALLFAVIGAKLSEGLNFTDDLARAVIIIGMPYANLGSPELKERLDYFKRTQTTTQAHGRDPAAELYENMCMNAVNQSIGRAIRHRGDWSCLVLLDKRYGNPRIRNKLPKWIGDEVTVTKTFGEAMKEMGAFYKAKRDG